MATSTADGLFVSINGKDTKLVLGDGLNNLWDIYPDGTNAKLTFRFNGTNLATLSSTGGWSPVAGEVYGDDDILTFGTGGDVALIERSTTLAANTALTNVLVGTVVSAATPADSLLLSNTTADGDIALFTRNAAGANSIEMMRLDASAGLIVFNEASADVDFRVESNGNANALVIDGGNDSIGLLGAAPSSGVALTSAAAAALAVGANGGTNPVFSIDASAATVATGLKVTGAAAASRAALAVISSGTDEGLDIDAKGAGTIRLANTSTGNIVTGRTFASSAAITSSSATAGIGYATGAGGTVTQMTNKTTGVTLNTVTGLVTMNNASLAADTTAAFTLTDSAIAATDTVLVVHDSVGTIGAYSFGATPASGSVLISVHNNTPGALGEAIVLRFVVIKSVNA